MSHYIPKGELVIRLAENIENNLDIEPRKISNYVQTLLDGIVSNDVVIKNLPKNYKRTKDKISCPICGKKISTYKGRMALHRRLKHETK